jgi:adenylate cyclase
MSTPLRFADLEISPSERAVHVGGRAVPIGARAFDVLMALAERRDRVVSKAELLDIVWPGLVVEENNLSVQVSALRKALGIPAIATVSGRGYRFVLPPLEALPTPAAQAPLDKTRVARRLAAVVAADMQGWQQARQGGRPQAGIEWQRLRSELVENRIAAFGGRTVELRADEMLIEFTSLVDAMGWALELQRELQQRQQQGLGHLGVRVGLAVDDVVVEDGRLIGDGVRLARLAQQKSGPGEICVPQATRALLADKLPLQARALPPVLLDGLEVELVALTAAPTAAHTPSVQPQMHGPGLAVLPFDCAVDEAYFGDGITEEIIAALAPNRAFYVISRQSTLHYRGSALQPARIAAELGVRYLLRGSARRAGTQLRITAELIDASNGRTLWADRYMGSGEDLFRFQSEIATSLSAAIDPLVHQAELARLVERPTSNLSAYDCVLRGLSVLYTFHAEDFAMAGRCFRQAIDLDPRYAQAHAHLAWWHNLKLGEGRSVDLGEDGQAAETLSRRALELDPRDAWSLSVAGHIQSFVRHRFDEAMTMFDQALEAHPNSVPAWARSATTLAYLGRGEEALERVGHAMRLSPFDPQRFTFYTTAGTASLVCQRYDEAVAWLAKARSLNPGYRAALRQLVAALSLAGERSEAEAMAQEMLQVDPAFSVAALDRLYPLVQPHRARFIQGLRMAGLPD